MPVKVYNNATQQVVEVDPKEAQRGLQQGDYSATGRVRVSKGNRTGSVDAADLLTALGQGAELVDEAGAAKVKMRREEESLAGQIQGGAEATLAGATLGISTAVEELAGADAERMRMRRDVLGKGGTALEVAGGLLPAVLSGGGSAAAGGARGLAGAILRNTPTGLATRLSVRAGEGLAARLGTETVGSRILARGARDFIEGGLQGAGAQLDENVLGERELTADLLGATAFGGVFGVGAGMGASGLAKVATGAVRAPVRGMMGVLGRMNAGSGGLAAREVAEMAVREGQQSLSPLAQGWKKTSMLAGAPEDLAERLARRGDTEAGIEQIRRVDQEMPRIQERAARIFAEDIPTLHGAMDEARRLAGGPSKARYWERQMPKAADAQVAASGATDDLFLSQRGRIEQLAADNVDPRFPGAFKHAPGVLREGDGALTKFERELVEAEQLSGTARATKKAMAADAYKRELGEIIDNNGGWGKMRQATPEVRAANIELRKMYGEVKGHLERADLWGEAASTQGKLNGLYRASAEADDLFKEATAGTGLGTVINPDGSMNMAKALKLARAHGKIGGDVTVTRLMDAMKARVDYLDELARHVDADDAFKAAHGKAKDGFGRLKKEMDSLADDAAVADDLATHRAIVGNKSPSHTMLTTQGPALLGMLGLGFGGPVGAAVGMAAGALTNPHRTLLNYASLRGMLNNADKKLNGAISGMFAKQGGRFAMPKLPKIELPRSPVGVAGRAAAKTDDERKKRRETALARAAELSQSPDAVERALAVKHYELHQVAPGIAGTLQQRVQKQAAFLASKAPKTYVRGSKTRLVDPVSAASFERYLSAVEDPIGTLDRFAQGRMTGEEVEAIRVCFPALYKDVQERIVQHMADADAKGEEIDYETRVKIGQMFQVPTDPSLQPLVANEIQLAIGANFDEPNAAQSMNGPETQKPAHAGKIEMNTKALATGSERTASWRTA